jgi:hypothetical protein
MFNIGSGVADYNSEDCSSYLYHRTASRIGRSMAPHTPSIFPGCKEPVLSFLFGLLHHHKFKITYKCKIQSLILSRLEPVPSSVADKYEHMILELKSRVSFPEDFFPTVISSPGAFPYIDIYGGIWKDGAILEKDNEKGAMLMQMYPKVIKISGKRHPSILGGIIEEICQVTSSHWPGAMKQLSNNIICRAVATTQA